MVRRDGPARIGEAVLAPERMRNGDWSAIDDRMWTVGQASKGGHPPQQNIPRRPSTLADVKRDTRPESRHPLDRDAPDRNPIPKMVTLYHDGSLIAELEDVIQSGSKDKRIDTLRRITDLFVTDADRFSVQQIRVFDDVLGHLIKRIEGKALAELSQRLGPIYNPPTEVVKRLARDDNVAVAEPILTQSCGLSDVDLIEIARTKTQSHLQAISARPQISANVTDILLIRGDSPVFHKLAGNFGANFSENGFAALVKRSKASRANP
jgi:hypothetical protein